MRQKRKLKRTRGCDFIGDRNVVEFRDVKIGVDDGNVVRIESGLKEGDKVVLNDSSQIASGMRVDAHERSLRPSGKQ
jgi:multidrug efflux pump subunit AcrA (membrane-fusion protein)